MLVLGGTWASAQRVYTVDDVPNVRLSGMGNSVSNPDGTLSETTVAEINRKLADLQQQTSIEVAVVVIESIGDDTPEDFGIRLFRQWGIGKQQKNNGLLILLVTADRIIRFEVGYGLEGVLTDAMSKRIQTTRMMPYLQSGDWDNAIIVAVDAVSELLTDPDSDLRNEPERARSQEESFPFGMLLGLGMMLVFLLLSVWGQRRKNRCPRCGTQMKIVDTKTYRVSPSLRRVATTLRCPKCGYTTTRNTTHNTGGGIGGGMGGFGGGGSWGGGSAGGGGSTTRF
ncbi:TPM domain-containing protein [Alistipes sp. OttesenSCG-928-L06]|nr:TPM domain-containing protein [Alistipes sp. OttesenSCG-928-L06]